MKGISYPLSPSFFPYVYRLPSSCSHEYIDGRDGFYAIQSGKSYWDKLFFGGDGFEPHLNFPSKTFFFLAQTCRVDLVYYSKVSGGAT